MVSVSCFGVRVSVMFHFMFVHNTFSSVWVAESSGECYNVLTPFCQLSRKLSLKFAALK